MEHTASTVSTYYDLALYLTYQTLATIIEVQQNPRTGRRPKAVFDDERHPGILRQSVEEHKWAHRRPCGSTSEFGTYSKY